MKRALMVGAGGWARQCWIDEVLPDFKDKIDIVGLTDINESALNESREVLGLSPEACFTKMVDAFAKIDADFCIICIPPAVHKDAVLLAAEKGMDILSEKPIADTLPDANAILAAVTSKSLKMTITQNYRPEVPILTLKKALQSGELGRLNYIVARLANDYRKPMSWGVDHVHTRDNPLLVEGAVHQLDMLRNLSGSNCETIAGFGWNPEWSSFKGNPSNLMLLQMENGVKAVYEGNQLAAGQLNTWFRELYRVECEKGSAVIDRDQVVRVYRRNEDGQQVVEEVQPVELSISGHQAIVQDFLNWIDGGPPTETRLEDNIHSVAMVYAAIDATTEGGVRKVSDYLPG